MNREIKFRGKRIDNGEWIFGNYGILGEGTDIESHVIMTSTLQTCGTIDRFYFTDHEVVLNSVGQFTGLKDKNGVEIYEGDIVVKKESDWSVTDTWEEEDERWHKGDFVFALKETNRDFVTLDVLGYWLKNEDFGYEGENLQQPEYYEIIGNIIDNPELLNNG